MVQFDESISIDEGKKSLSQRIKELTARAETQSLTLGEVEAELSAQGSAALICFLCVPFLFPVPLPGISTMFGAAIIALTLKIIFGKEAKLPEKWSSKTVPKELFTKVLGRSVKVFVYLEKLSRPRLKVLATGPGKTIAGISMIVAAIGLALPIPPIIPLTNTIPAIAIFLCALGLLEDDGALVIAGHIMCVVSWTYLLIVGASSFAATKYILDKIIQLF